MSLISSFWLHLIVIGLEICGFFFFLQWSFAKFIFHLFFHSHYSLFWYAITITTCVQKWRNHLIQNDRNNLVLLLAFIHSFIYVWRKKIQICLKYSHFLKYKEQNIKIFKKFRKNAAFFNFQFFKNAKKNKERLGPKGSWGHFALQYTLVCEWRWFEIVSIKGVVPGSNFGRNKTNK